MMDATAVLARFPDLPPEIVSTICQNAGRDALKSLRRVSKKMREHASPEIFRTLYLRVSLQSYDRLKHIYDAPHLRGYVRALNYDGRLLPVGKETPEDYEELLRSYCGWELCDFYGNPVEQEIVFEAITRCFTLRDIDAQFRNYLGYLSEQKRILGDDFEVDALIQAFKNLPNLVSLHLDTGLPGNITTLFLPEHPYSYSYMDIPITPKGLRKALDQLGEIGRSCWIEPGFPRPENDSNDECGSTNTFGVKRLLALMDASSQSGLFVKSLSVTGLNFEHDQAKILLPPQPMVQNFLTGLSYLSIDVRGMGHISDELWDHMAFLMSFATEFKRL